MGTARFGRMITAMVTPFDATKGLDPTRAAELAERLVDAGNDALALCATTGESPTLSHEEKLSVVRAVKDAVGRRAALILNVGDNSTARSVAFAREAGALGVDAVMCVVPYYNKPPQEGLFEHFKAVAHAAHVPVVLYNIPGRCVINLEATTCVRLARACPNIVAIKEASGRFEQIQRIIDEAPEGFDVYSGDDSATLEIMRRGGAGVVSTIGNVATAPMRQIVDACADGKFDEAQRAHAALLPLMEGLFETANPILTKEALRIAGFSVGGVRLPLVDATEEQSMRLASLMRDAGVVA